MKTYFKPPSFITQICVFALFLSFATGCDLVEDLLDDHNSKKNRTYHGPHTKVGDGTAHAWVTLDSQGKPISIGINFSEKALKGLPDEAKEYDLELPTQASLTQYNHVTFEWNPQGHDPKEVYDVPHFDVHFYMITKEQRESITGLAPPAMDPAPDAKYIPVDFVQGPGRVPRMGVHWVDVQSPEFNGGKFTKTFIYGTYNKEVVFYEPMVTKDYLLTKPNATINLRQPEAFQRNGFYPSKYAVKYNSSKKEYTIALQGLSYKFKQ